MTIGYFFHHCMQYTHTHALWRTHLIPLLKIWQTAPTFSTGHIEKRMVILPRQQRTQKFTMLKCLTTLTTVFLLTMESVSFASFWKRVQVMHESMRLLWGFEGNPFVKGLLYVLSMTQALAICSPVIIHSHYSITHSAHLISLWL